MTQSQQSLGGDAGLSAQATVQAERASGQLQVIARFEQISAAHDAAARLQAKGITCHVTEAEGAAGQAGELLVPRHELMRVTDILQKTPARQNLVARSATPLEVARVTCPDCRGEQIKRVWPILRMLIGGVVLTPLLLPWAGSNGRMLYMILVTIWIPCCLVNPLWQCRKCGKRWKPASLTAQTPLAQQDPQVPENKGG